MALPGNLRLRRPSGADEDAVLVLVLVTACEIADTGRSDRELADVRELWAEEGVDPARDAWVALDAVGDAIGYAFVHDRRAEVCVHPRARGVGLGTRLRELVEARAAEQGAREVEQMVAGGNHPAERQLERAGYVPVRHIWRLERPLDVAPPPPRWPSGVATHEPAGDADAAEVLALLERARATLPDGRPLALDRFHAEHLAPELLDPALCVLATRDDTLVGAAVCETWDESHGAIAQVAVDPAEDVDALGSALLLAALARLRERGLDTAVLHAGGRDQDPPLPYTDAGMRAAWRRTIWRKRLR